MALWRKKRRKKTITWGGENSSRTSKTNFFWHESSGFCIPLALCQLLLLLESSSRRRSAAFRCVTPPDEVCNPSATCRRVSHGSSGARQNESKYTEKRLRQADGSDWKSSLKWKYILLCSDADSLYLCLCLSFIIPVCRVCCLQLAVNLLIKFEFQVFLVIWKRQRVPVQRKVCALVSSIQYHE